MERHACFRRSRARPWARWRPTAARWAAKESCCCRPNEILIFSGRKHRNADGSESGYRVIFGGRAWRMPLIEQVMRMDMRTIPIDVQVQGAYTRVGIALKVKAIAVVKISSNPQVVMNA